MGKMIFIAVTISCLVGCGPRGNNAGAKKNASQLQAELTKYYLDADDLAAFKTGRAKDDVLQDVQWRGGLIGACEHEGVSVVAIQFSIRPEGSTAQDSVVADAVFIDEKFVKFVPMDTGEELGIQQKDPDGLWATVPIPRRLDDTRWLIRHIEHRELTPDDLRSQVASLKSTTPAEDIGGLPVRYEPLQRNSQLGDQFNPARVRIGMTDTEVRATVGAEPLETGTAAAGTYAIFGSNEACDVGFYHYINFLVRFRNGKATMIVPIFNSGTDENWRKSLCKWFVDLPPPSGD